jgi:hypothetical protein
MCQIECQREIKQIQETLPKDKILLSTTLSRIFESEAKIRKLHAKLGEKHSAKMADWESPEFDAARLSIRADSSR